MVIFYGYVSLPEGNILTATWSLELEIMWFEVGEVL